MRSDPRWNSARRSHGRQRCGRPGTRDSGRGRGRFGECSDGCRLGRGRGRPAGRPLRLLYAANTYRRALYASVETVERERQRGRDVLKDTADRLAEQYPELQINKELSQREPTVSLHDAAGSDGTIVVGNRGYGGFAALLLGSVGLRVAAGATVPVVVVRRAAAGAETGVVVAAVRDEDDLDCVRHAARGAELRKASLRLLSIWQVLRYVGMVATMLDDVDEIAQQHLHRVSAVADRIRDEFPELTVAADVEEGTSVAGALVEASRRADLLSWAAGGRPMPSAPRWDGWRMRFCITPIAPWSSSRARAKNTGRNSDSPRRAPRDDRRRRPAAPVPPRTCLGCRRGPPQAPCPSAAAGRATVARHTPRRCHRAPHRPSAARSRGAHFRCLMGTGSAREA